MFYHRIEDCQQLAHAGHHGDLVGLAVAAQALVKSANDRVVDPRGEGRHVQNGAHLTPATPGSAAALMFAAIVMKGGDADQGGDTLPMSCPSSGNCASSVQVRIGSTPGTSSSRSRRSL